MPHLSITTNRQDPSSPCHSGLSRILLLIRSHLSYSTKKDSRQAGMTDHRGQGFPTSENDRSQRAWNSCLFWLSLSLPVKNRQDPSSPCHSGLSRILLSLNRKKTRKILIHKFILIINFRGFSRIS